MRASSIPFGWRLSLAVAALTACRGPTTGSFCFDFIVEEPLVNIVAVTDAQNGASLGEVLIGNFRLAGREADARVVAGGPSSAYGITFEGNQIRCTLSCGFGDSEGQYEFTISGAGYQPLTVSVDARYGTVRCDGYRFLSGGPRLQFQLTPL